MTWTMREAPRRAPAKRCAQLLVLLGCLLGATAPTAAQEPYDIVITGGRLLDGTGIPWYYADVAIKGEVIVAVGDLGNAEARRIIDATGLYVAPGFIDVHTHAGGGLATPELSGARPLLAQGITTIVANPDGGGPVDLAAQGAALLEHGLGVNVALLVPHGSVRQQILAMEARAPTPADEGARPHGYGARCLWPILGSLLRARELRDHRAGDRAGEGRGRVRRRLHQPHP
jgi:hypothetical protein